MSRFSMDWSELSLQVMITFAHFLLQACVVGLVLFVAQHVAESLGDSGILHVCCVSRKRVSFGETDLREADLFLTKQRSSVNATHGPENSILNRAGQHRRT